MPNSAYKRGAEKERRIVNSFKAKGCLAFRSAGSHSPIDVFVLNPKSHEIKLIQSKLGKSYTQSFKDKLLRELEKYNGSYEVSAEVWD